MEAVEVINLRKRPIGSLSGGQFQRVLIARALTCNPEIMILDEPTANVDMKVEKDIFDLLKKLTEEVVEYANVEVPPKSEGKQIMMILVPQVAK